ncbi:ACP S-malonyltransferase [Brevibacillus dissolubilis]|uniref:ACP S-malonyltransferase n=1 Tax=Brevibacillus dissolubilis TaxID=1844116 RepID=UPI0011176241|nr:ACP S-malonyltransferase [Brevibacillus dissolubilis]
MLAYVFPGQGSQKKGMGSGLFDEFPEITAQADTILGYSIKELCLEDSDERLGQTQYTQPALYVVNALTYMKKVKDTGKVPDVVAGHSLGEYNALFAAGAFDFATGLQLVKKRGELMSRAFGGGMAAVINLNEEAIRRVLQENQLESIDIANYNSPKQIVIAGPREDIERAKTAFEVAGAMYILLKVSGAFHSRYMMEAQEQFREFLQTYPLSELKIPVIANISARPYRQSELMQNLTEQITNSVKWCETIQVMMGLRDIEIQEVGPGNTLSGLEKRIRKEAEPIVISLDEYKERAADVVAQEHTEAYQQVAAGIHTETIPVLFTAQTLGSAEFKKDYNLKLAYVSGAMYKGIGSKELVVRMGKAGMMGFLGTGGLRREQIVEAIEYIQKELRDGQSYGMNLLHTPTHPEREEQNVDLYIQYGVVHVEAAAFMSITPALIKYRAHGLQRNPDGSVAVKNRIIAKLSRPEVAAVFLSPAPEQLVEKMVKNEKLTREQAELLKEIPMADDLCLEADSGGHTDAGVSFVMMPAMVTLRDSMMKKYGYHKPIRLGLAGGIGTPDAAAAAFIMGADFIVTGSINQCTVEAGTSDAVKDLLQQINIQDTEYAPAGDMFEIGARVQVLKKGVFFPARANKLYELYRQYNSLDEIDEKTKKQLEEKYFKRSITEVYEEVRRYQPPEEIQKAEQNPKHKMALVFRWYFAYSTRLALDGTPGQQVNYQIHCGPALGAFNQWVKGTSLEDWRNRHVDEIGIKLMTETAELLTKRVTSLLAPNQS